MYLTFIRNSLFCSLLFGSLHARFLIEDTRLVDQEERFSTENYNDILGYRYPIHWNDLWDAADFGYRVNAGSLNAKRFQYEEDIKVLTGQYEGVGFSFTQERVEDFVEERQDRDVRFRFRNAMGPYLAFFGNGGKYKQFGDLGVAVGWDQDRRNQFELYYVSVDHYYRQKKLYDEDSRSKDIYSYGVKARKTLGRFQFDSRYEYDAPFAWYRDQADYHYHYFRSVLSAKLTYAATEKESYYLSSENEWKGEGKRILSTQNSKRFTRQVKIAEIGREYRGATADTTFGVMNAYRKAVYDQEGDFAEGISPDLSERKEWAVFATRYFKTFSPGVQLGIFSNRVAIHLPDGGKDFEWETKGQIFWDMKLNKYARVVLNTTWDFDQLYKDYPFEGDKTFKPWGGGGIQFIAVF